MRASLRTLTSDIETDKETKRIRRLESHKDYVLTRSAWEPGAGCCWPQVYTCEPSPRSHTECSLNTCVCWTLCGHSGRTRHTSEETVPGDMLHSMCGGCADGLTGRWPWGTDTDQTQNKQVEPCRVAYPQPVSSSSRAPSSPQPRCQPLGDGTPQCPHQSGCSDSWAHDPPRLGLPCGPVRKQNQGAEIPEMDVFNNQVQAQREQAGSGEGAACSQGRAGRCRAITQSRGTRLLTCYSVQPWKGFCAVGTLAPILLMRKLSLTGRTELPKVVRPVIPAPSFRLGPV